MTDKQSFTIVFSAFAPKLREQITAAGFELKEPADKAGSALAHLQLDADAVARLRIRGRLTVGQAMAAEKKIGKEIVKLIK